MTSVIAPATPEVMGKAIYLELVSNPDAPASTTSSWRSKYVTQVIVIPPSYDSSGSRSDAMIWTRSIAEHSPRAQWDSTKLSRFPKPTPNVDEEEGYSRSYVQYSYYDRDELLTLPEKAKLESIVLAIKLKLTALSYETHWAEPAEGDERVLSAFQSQVVRKGKPLAVEFTNEDLAQALAYKTPQALIRRINKMRDACGFPEKVYN